MEEEDQPSTIGEYSIIDLIMKTPRSTIYSAVDKLGKRIVIKGSPNEAQLKNEYQLLMEIDHPNVIKTLSFMKENNISYIIFPNAQGGDLLEKLTSEGPFEEDFVRKILRGIFDAVVYLHSVGVIHREITLENILIFYQKGEESFKLGGFLLAIKDKTSNDFCGTIPYIAPEIIEKKEYDNKVDSWNLGIIMYALLTNVYPYLEKYEPDKIDYANIPEETKDLISHLLCPNPTERYSVQQALEHPFFKK